MIDSTLADLSVKKQCELLTIPRSTYYYEPVKMSNLNLQIMRKIDKQYLITPYYGYRRMTKHLHRLGYGVNHKRVLRLMKLMAIEAIYPKPRTTLRDNESKKYPYLLENLQICPQNHVWASDITYIPCEVYLNKEVA